jgi:hypothetical protein
MRLCPACHKRIVRADKFVAMANGVRLGRRPKLTADQCREALARRAEGETLVAIGRSYGVSHSTISRLQA